MTPGQPAVVTEGTLKGKIGEIIKVDWNATIIDIRFEDGSTFGFYPSSLRQISPLEGLARMVDYERR
jgi:hypothetical protein